MSALVLLALGGATWLFATGDEDAPDQSAQQAPAATTPADDRIDGVLSLPSDTTAKPTDSRRRGTQGRDRIDPESAVTSPDAPTDDDEPDDARPAVLANLKGQTIALGAASSPTPGSPTRLVQVGELKVPCGGGADPSRATVELDLIARLDKVLTDAGARVTLVDDPAACVDVRARRAKAADMTIIVRHGDSAAARVFPGRATRVSTKVAPATAPTARLTNEIAIAAFGLKAATAARNASDRLVLNQAGAFDLTGGSAMTLVELPARVAPIGDRTKLALSIATAMGVVAAGPQQAQPAN